MRLVDDCDEAVQSRLPEIENIRKGIQRERRRHLPSNPLSIEDLGDLPDVFKKTLGAENFLLYDSLNDGDFDLNCGRILIFATRQNLQKLFLSEIWYLDGTFDVVPSLFFQLFTIMGSVTQKHRGQDRKIALPFVYALLESKTEAAYNKVIEEVIAAAEGFGIPTVHPQAIMSDFELAIVNAIKKHFPENIIRLCLFHLCQSVYRKVQEKGLQQRYNDPNDNSIRKSSHSMCALAFVPTEEVKDVFDSFYDEVPDDFLDVAHYFEVTYIRGIPARGRRRATQERYAPALWNHYNSVINGTARTNNASEGWHNRFQKVVGRSHPSIYSFLKELQKEQGTVEYALRELQLGKKVKNLPRGRVLQLEDRIFNIVQNWQEYVDNEDELSYIKNLGYNLHL